MILQALNEYYERKEQQGTNELPRFGFEPQPIKFIFELDNDGRLMQFKSSNKKTENVPQGPKRTSNIAANLLWDNAEYALGIMRKKGGTENQDAERQKVIEKHETFIEKIKALPDSAILDAGIQAVLKFLSDFDPASLKNDQHWEELQKNPYISFQLQGDSRLICQRPTVIKTVESDVTNAAESFCLITGQQDQVSRTHPAIKGVWDAESSGANIVSFNQASFCSFQKKQGNNAPIGEKAAFSYTAALNHLLRKDSDNRIQVGDASTVFWSAQPSELESNFGIVFENPDKDNPDRFTEAVKAIYQSVKQGGKLSVDETGKQRFYVLGLAPNKARIAIRFWVTGTTGEIAERIKQHFDNLEIEHDPKEPPLTLSELLKNVAVQEEINNVPPNLGGEVMRSILNGTPYPFTLFAAAIRRCKAKQKDNYSRKAKQKVNYSRKAKQKVNYSRKAKQKVNYPRAALIKAYLNRISETEEIQVKLDTKYTNPAYLLGRLFSVFFKLQEEAHPDIKATISDRYYGAASSSPGGIFPVLVKLHKHHLTKLEQDGRKVHFEKLIGEIMDKLSAENPFPAILNMQDQGRFAVGFYHQRQAFFTKRAPQQTEEDQS